MFRWLMRLLGLDKSEASAPPAAPTDATPSPGTEPPVAAPPVDRPVLAPTATLPPNEVIAPVTLVPVGPPPWRDGDRLRSLDPESVHNHLVSELDTLIREVRAKRSDTRDGDLRLIERLIQRVDRRQLDLPPFPDIARELDTLLRQPDTDLVQIARVVERDPGLIRRVWTCARSAMYNSPPRSLHHAVARVGLDTLWQIGMSVCLNDTVFRVEGFQAQADAARTHGLISAEVAALLSGERRGSVYMAALLHDVGHLIVLRTAGGRSAIQRPSEATVLEVIRRTHTAFGLLVIESWKLDDLVAAAVGYHHDPLSAPADSRATAAAVAAGHIAAHMVMLGDATHPHNALARADIAELGFDPDLALNQARQTLAELSSQESPPEDLPSTEPT
jgi:HD-like signal output (HDOD) protein